MYSRLLDLICEKKIYVDISGLTSAGSEKTLAKSKDIVMGYVQDRIIFTESMVKTILFHERGCTITLKH